MSGTVGTGAGNTRIRSRAWVFTLNNPEKYDFTVGTVQEGLDTFGAERYLFQLEEGEEGTPHFQGVVYFKNPLELKSLKPILGRKVHWERCNHWPKAVEYCQKQASRVDGPWAKGVTLKKDVKLIEVPFDWQQKVIDECQTEPDDRKINWIWCESGGTGKTQLAKLLVVKYGAILVGGKASDAKFAILRALKSGKEIKVVVFLFPRSSEEFVSYDAIESIKDGIFFSSKYESEAAVFNSPHIFVFCNFRPDYKKLSSDRWEVIKLPKIQGDQ